MEFLNLLNYGVAGIVAGVTLAFIQLLRTYVGREKARDMQSAVESGRRDEQSAVASGRSDDQVSGLIVALTTLTTTFQGFQDYLKSQTDAMKDLARRDTDIEKALIGLSASNELASQARSDEQAVLAQAIQELQTAITKLPDLTAQKVGIAIAEQMASVRDLLETAADKLSRELQKRYANAGLPLTAEPPDAQAQQQNEPPAAALQSKTTDDVAPHTPETKAVEGER